MNPSLVTQNLGKVFAGHTALKSLSLEIPAGRIVGLLGRNGAGKTTLLNLACGLLLPTSGTCTTLGRVAGEMDSPELSRLGVVFQEGRYLDWMTVARQLAFNASFYPTWDKAREKRLLGELELDSDRKISELSTGDRQKLGIILGVCHHPSLLLLDEPVSALDPIVRSRMLAFLVDLIREDGCTMVISSHILSDVEKVVDWVVCLEKGELAANASLDEIQESHAEWRVTSAAGRLPATFVEPWILTQSGDTRQALLTVRGPGRHQALLTVRCPGAAAEAQFVAMHGASIERRALSLDEIFPLLIRKQKAAA